MKLSSSSQEDNRSSLGRKCVFNLSPTPRSPQSSPLSSLSSSSTSPLTTTGVSVTNVYCKPVRSLGDAQCHKQSFSVKTENDLLERKHSPYLHVPSESFPSFLTSPCAPAIITHQEDHLTSNLVMADKVHSYNLVHYSSPDSMDAAESLPVQIKSRRLVCCWMSCGQKFSNQKELAVHVNDDHVRIECPDVDFQCRWQGCPRQGRGFNARYKMLIHIRTHTNEKPHMCGVCHKSFSRLENLKIHIRSHTGEKPYICTFPGCRKAYSNSSDRFKHVRTHQEDKPYKCKMPGCRKRYTDPSSLRKHVRTHGHTLDSSSGVVLHHSHSIEEPQGDYLKLVESHGTTGQGSDVQTDLNKRRVCELSSYDNCNHRKVQKRSDVHDNREVIHGISNYTGENGDFRQNLNNYEHYIETVSKVVFSENRPNNLDMFGDSEDRKNNLNMFRGVEDRMTGLDRMSRGAENRTNNLEKVFRGDGDRMNNLERAFSGDGDRMNNKSDRLRDAISNSDILQLCSLNTEKDQYINHLKNEHISEKCDPLFNSPCYCDEQRGRKRSIEEENKPVVVFASDHNILKHCDNITSDFPQTPDIKSPFSIQSFSQNKFLNFSSPVESECHEKAKVNSSSSSLTTSTQPTKTSHIEHWKKRKIMNREKELQASLQLTSSLSPSAQEQMCHSSSAPHNSQSCCESPASSSDSLLSHPSTASSTSFIDTHSPMSLSRTSPTSNHATTTYDTPTFVPPISQLLPHSSPSVPQTPPCQAMVSSMYLSHYYPPPMYPLFSNSYSSIPSYSGVHPSFYSPNLSGLTLSTSSILPFSNSYHYDNPADHHNDCYLSSVPSIHQPEHQLTGAKNTWQHVSFNCVPLLRSLEDTSILSAVSISQLATRLGLIYQDFPLDLSPLYQNHRTGFPLHLGVNR